MTVNTVEEVTDAILSLRSPALCLDFDGTLVEIAPRPEAIHVPDHLPALLHRVNARLAGRLAIITGRAHSDLSNHLDVTAFPVASSHGAEFSPAGSLEVHALLDPTDLDPLRPGVSAQVDKHEGVYLEDKGSAIAVHTRPSPDAHRPLVSSLKMLADDHEAVHVAAGRGIVELRLAAENKGTAIARLVELPGWNGVQPVMVGDDITDNDGMAVAKRLGGFGVQIGEGPDGTGLSHAALRLQTVDDALALLRALAG